MRSILLRVYMKHRVGFICALAALGFAGCGGGSTGSDDNGIGQACFTEYAEPVLTLSNVTDSATGAPVRSVTISSISVQGVPVEPVAVTAVSSNVTVSGSSLSCQLPCAFSNLEGEYRFTVRASGYQDRLALLTASYSRRSGNCTVTYSGTTSIGLQLVAQ